MRQFGIDGVGSQRRSPATGDLEERKKGLGDRLLVVGLLFRLCGLCDVGGPSARVIPEGLLNLPQSLLPAAGQNNALASLFRFHHDGVVDRAHAARWASGLVDRMLVLSVPQGEPCRKEVVT